MWAGPDPDRPTWAITASPHTPISLLADLSEALAHETGTRQPQPGREHRTHLAAASATAAPAVTAGRASKLSRSVRPVGDGAPARQTGPDCPAVSGVSEPAWPRRTITP
ncbi:DUF317 domain-containing protein [Streptomyces sp. enrichment culture]|uniref:DUF317 domain-containing protein n=1 Tax=Streptomyces sp. enrichment culture TaxID=1795815 RepID=UPI003F57A10F